MYFALPSHLQSKTVCVCTLKTEKSQTIESCNVSNVFIRQRSSPSQFTEYPIIVTYAHRGQKFNKVKFGPTYEVKHQ